MTDGAPSLMLRRRSVRAPSWRTRMPRRSTARSSPRRSSARFAMFTSLRSPPRPRCSRRSWSSGWRTCGQRSRGSGSTTGRASRPAGPGRSPEPPGRSSPQARRRLWCCLSAPPSAYPTVLPRAVLSHLLVQLAGWGFAVGRRASDRWGYATLSGLANFLLGVAVVGLEAIAVASSAAQAWEILSGRRPGSVWLGGSGLRVLPVRHARAAPRRSRSAGSRMRPPLGRRPRVPTRPCRSRRSASSRSGSS